MKEIARGTERELQKWQERFSKAEKAYRGEQDKMKFREDRVDGTEVIRGPDGQSAKKSATHVRNICFEMIETQVDSAIPAPKVTAVRAEDEGLAKVVEDMLRNLMDKLPMERINDEAERISPTQGGCGLLVEWLPTAAGRGWMGEVQVTLLHPRKIIPQYGIYQVREMDYLFVEESLTKTQVKTLYGVDMEDETEEAPEARALDAETDQTDELVTLRTAYYRNAGGGIGRFRWVGDKVCESMEDYQVRRVKLCKTCGAVGDGVRCAYCGGRHFAEELQEEEELTEDRTLPDGTILPAMQLLRGEYGEPLLEGSPLLGQLAPQGEAERPIGGGVQTGATRIPYYKPDIYPVILRKNVSKPGKFLGGSDIDAIEPQQNTSNMVCTKINEKTLGGGSFTTVPKGAGHLITDGDNRWMELERPADKQLLGVYNTQVDISQDLNLRAAVYEEARQIIGITDAMQGRRDPTATSAVAKQFSAQQAAGRLESKKTMKRALFQELFEVLFKFMLAYADEPRPVRSYNERGETEYSVFDRHDFLYRDEAGEWRYNTDFLFSCDDAAPLAADRQAMWQECRLNFQQGAMGPVAELATLIRFWAQMEKLHYPMAGDIKKSLEEEKRAQAAPVQPDGTAVNAAAPQGLNLSGLVG